jgi:glutathione S-transferase
MHGQGFLTNGPAAKINASTEKSMQLYCSQRSPFARFVMVFAHEVGLSDSIRKIPTAVARRNPNRELMAVNPLGQLPTLLLEDGSVLYDSRTICDYFDGLHANRPLIPLRQPARGVALCQQALGLGFMDILVAWNSLRRHGTAAEQSMASVYSSKAEAILASLEDLAPRLHRQPLAIGHIAIG